MTTSDEPPAPADLDALAASLQADAGDAGVFFPVLCEKLLDALPACTEVEREHSLVKRKRRPRRVTIRFGDDTFEAELAQGVVTCRHSHFVSGIGGGLPYSRQVSLADWLAAVLAALAAEAQTSAAATAALRSLVT